MIRRVDRREFLTRAGVLAGACVLATLPSRSAVARRSGTPARSTRTPQRAVFREMPYFSLDGTGQTYDRPAGNRSTRNYVDRIGEEEYLRRHWFA